MSLGIVLYRGQVPLIRKIPSGSSPTTFVSFIVKRPPPTSTSPTDPSDAGLPYIFPVSSQHSKLSLLQELFPENAPANAPSDTIAENVDAQVPPLPLPTVDELFEGFAKYHDSVTRVSDTTKAASSDAYKHKKIAVLVLQAASKSLVENDFRRIAPKGAHIEGWSGRGGILRVFPARDPITLEQAEHYFVVFTNPAYARAYQSHVLRLYRLARDHTPTSVESPLSLPRGLNTKGKDFYTMLQDFTICPPAQRIQLKFLFTPLSPGMRRILVRGGYLGLHDGVDRAGMALLFWVDGEQLTLREADAMIASHGRERGMAWDLSITKLDTLAVPTTIAEDCETSEDIQTLEPSGRHRAAQRYVLTFRDENEARRFIRVWHRKRLASSWHGEPRRVHTEFLW